MKIAISQIAFNRSNIVDEEQLQGLQDSIKEKGLSHPIIVRRANTSEDTPCEPPYTLVSGEKRLLAHLRLELPEIDAVIRDVSEREGKELRLHENLKRFNLPWYEQVVLVEELHALRQEEHGVASKGRPAKNETKQGWSIRDTAAELKVGVGPLSEDLSLARALRNDPTLSKVKDKKTAIRLARIVVQRYESEQEAGLPSTFEANQVYLGDSAIVLSKLPPASIDHCITDPPWIKFFDNSLRIDDRTLPVFREVYRVLKYGAFCYVVCGLDDYAYYVGTSTPNPADPSENIHQRGELEKIGFQVANTPIIWQKKNSLSRRGVRPWEYDRDFEFIIVAVKGNPTLTTSRLYSGIKTFPIVHPSHMIHPNEKPIELIEELIEDCSYRNQVILDPFGGSGVVAHACKKSERRYITCERDKKFYDGICERLAKA